MNNRTILIIGAMMVTAMAAVPAVSADGFNEPSQQQQYIMGGDFFVVCDPPIIQPQVGGVCFQLTGKEGEVDIAIQDRGQTELRRTESTLEGLTGVDAGTFGFVEAYYQVRDADGNVLSEDIFCSETIIQQVPEDATEILVFLDGAILGNPIFDRAHSGPDNVPSTTSADRCDTFPYEGATFGTVFLNTEVDP